MYNCYISYRLSLFFDLDFVGELFSHKQQQYFPVYEFHYHFTTASLQVSLYSFALNSLVETQDAIQFRATEGPSLIKLKAGQVKRKKRVRENNDVKVSKFILAEYILFKNKAL